MTICATRFSSTGWPKSCGKWPLPLPLLLWLLTEIRDQGRISRAVASVGLSYRHAWGMLREFEGQFGAALVKKARGQGAVLSPLAEKLFWADKRIAARLSLILDSVASELEQELAALLANDRRVLRITASHGFAIDALSVNWMRRILPLI